MNNFLKYLKAQSLRTIRRYPIILIFTLLMTFSIVFFVSSMFSANSNSEEKTKVKVALVGDISDSYLGIGIEAISKFDSSQYYVEFIPMSKSEAVKQLKSQELLGYIEIPDGLVDSIIDGENKHLTYVVGNSPATLGPVLMNEVIQMVSDLVTESQNGIYGLWDIGKQMGIPRDERFDLADKMALEYSNLILGRNEMYTVTEYGVGEALSFENYYISAFIVLILLLWGMLSVSLLVKNNLSLERTLRVSGHKTVGIVFGEYIPFFAMICFNIALILCGVFIASQNVDSSHELISLLSSSEGCVNIFISIIPAIALITAMQFFVYGLASNVISAVLMQLLIVVGMSYVSGFFFPLYSLPQSIQNLAVALPTYKAFNCIADALFDVPDMGNIMTIWGYFAIFMLLSVAVRLHKMRSSRYD